MVEGENEDKDAHPTSPAENEFLIFQCAFIANMMKRKALSVLYQKIQAARSVWP